MTSKARKIELQRLGNIRDTQLAEEKLLDHVQEDIKFPEEELDLSELGVDLDLSFEEEGEEEDAEEEEKDDEEEEEKEELTFTTPKKTPKSRNKKNARTELPPVFVKFSFALV